MNDEMAKFVIPNDLIADLKHIISQARQSAYAAVNACMIAAVWLVGVPP